MAHPGRKPLAVTMGEPAGIGGEITVAAWRLRFELALPPFFLLDDPSRISALAPDIPTRVIAAPHEADNAFAGALPILPVPLAVPTTPGQPDPANAAAVLRAIATAVDLCLDGSAGGIVTNPIHKGVLYQSGFRHPGHTEYLAELGEVDRTVMMLAGGGLRTVPVTVHVSLRQAVETLTSDLIAATCRIVHADLKRWFGIETPRLAMAGLNPHAGEGGALGSEEADILSPAIDMLRRDGINVSAPLPADTMFHEQARETYDVAICMYHDQALIPVKTLDFHGGVNITLGLPFIRTSPDHGTAFDRAGKGTARPDSLVAAIRTASEMAAIGSGIRGPRQ